MASIVKRGKHYCVVYTYVTSSGDRKQKWETFKNKADAEKRRNEVEYSKSKGSFIVPKCTTLEELAKEYIDLYGKSKWSMSTYGRNVALFENYILPVLGKMDLADITPRVIEKYYKSLLEMDAVPPKVNGRVIKVKEPKKVSPSVIRDAHKLLSSCFRQAVKWELMAKNPCENATRPKVEKTERNIWTMEDLQHALDVCEDDRLKLAINLAFSCTLRIGEMLGLTWDCVDISEEAMSTGMPYIHINKDVLFEFPAAREKSKTVMVLKTPKTRTSVRKVYLPISAARLLVAWKEKQNLQKEALGSEYTDYNLVFAGAFREILLWKNAYSRTPGNSKHWFRRGGCGITGIAGQTAYKP